MQTRSKVKKKKTRKYSVEEAIGRMILQCMEEVKTCGGGNIVLTLTEVNSEEEKKHSRHYRATNKASKKTKN